MGRFLALCNRMARRLSCNRGEVTFGAIEVDGIVPPTPPVPPKEPVVGDGDDSTVDGDGASDVDPGDADTTGDDTNDDGTDGDGDGGEDINIADVFEDEDRRRKAQNKAFAEMRTKNKELQKKLDAISGELAGFKKSQQSVVNVPSQQTFNPPVQDREIINGIPVPQSPAEWDALVKHNWQAAIDVKAALVARDVVKREREVSQMADVLSSSKQTVLKRHPELDDVGSEKTRIYRMVLENNPHYLKDPRGPIHAMREMEEYMEFELGMDRSEILKSYKRSTPSSSEQNVPASGDRNDRVQLLSSQGRPQPNSKNVVRLDKDDLEFCKFHRIDPKEYAKNKISLAKTNKGGLQ